MCVISLVWSGCCCVKCPAGVLRVLQTQNWKNLHRHGRVYLTLVGTSISQLSQYHSYQQLSQYHSYHSITAITVYHSTSQYHHITAITARLANMGLFWGNCCSCHTCLTVTLSQKKSNIVCNSGECVLCNSRYINNIIVGYVR